MKNKKTNIDRSVSESAAEGKKKRRRLFDKILTAVLVIVIIVCVANIVLILARYKKANSVYDDMQNKYLTPVDTSHNSSSENDSSETANSAVPDAFSVDFDALLAYNSDIVGWIYSDNTPISYPVAQTTDNDYYVRRSLDREYLITGTIFADYRCDKVGGNSNYIIYGHHMRNGTIFGSLEKYVTQEYYEEHPTFKYYTPDKTYVIDVYAGYVTDTNSDFFKPDFDEGERAILLKDAKEKSGFASNVEIGEDDTIMTLVTCSYQFNDARFLLIGKVRDE